MIMGFSAGGHLCATVGALYDRYEDETHRYDDISARPDKICLCYPLVSLLTDIHEKCIENFLGSLDRMEDRRALSAEMILSKDYPKTYLWACEDDPVVMCSHTKMMDAALTNKKPRTRCICSRMAATASALGKIHRHRAGLMRLCNFKIRRLLSVHHG